MNLHVLQKCSSIPARRAATAEMILKENPAFVVGDDFGGTDETIVSSKFEKPVFVHHYPSAVKAFYMKEDPKEPGTA